MMNSRMGTGSVLLQASSLSGCCQCGVSSWLLILTADSGNPGRSRVHFIMAVAGVALWQLGPRSVLTTIDPHSWRDRAQPLPSVISSAESGRLVRRIVSVDDNEVVVRREGARVGTSYTEY